MTRGASDPLEVIQRHVGETATRFLLNDGAHVVAHLTGLEAYTCISSKCVGARRYHNCEHIEAVEDYERTHPNVD